MKIGARFIKYWLLLAIITLVCNEAFAQQKPKGALVLGLTFGLNYPLADDNVGSKSTQVWDANNQYATRTEKISSQIVLPPISLDADVMLSSSWSLGFSSVFQIHDEKHTVTLSTMPGISDEWVQTKGISSFVLIAKYHWLNRPNFTLGSGLGVGGSFMQINGKYPGSEGDGVVDVHPIFLHYEICCNWHLNFDVRFMNGPLGQNRSGDLSAYNLGVGVIYVFNTRR